MITDLMTLARDFVTGLPEALQGVGVFLVSLIPFVEGEGAALIAVIAGVSPWLAVPAAVLGNLLAVWLLVRAAAGMRGAVTARAAARRAAVAPAEDRLREPVLAGVGVADAPAAPTEGTRAADVVADAPAAAPGVPADDAKRTALRRRFEAWGVAGLSLLGPWFFVPGHVAAPAMVSFGASPRRVMAWQVVAIVLYTGFTAAVAYGLGAAVLATAL